VLRKDGTLWLNLGDSYFAKPKSNYNGVASGLQAKNYGTGDTTLGYKQQADKFKSLLASGYKNKDLVGIPWRVAFALQAGGWYLRQDIIWHKPNAMPESVKDRCTKAHEYIFLLSKSSKYYYDAEAIKEPLARPEEPLRKTPAVFGGRNKHDGYGTRKYSGNKYVGTYTGRNKRSVWTVSTKPFPEAHFATFPPDLIKPCILAGCPEGGIVLDPFMGSGTTGMVAAVHQRNFIGFELNSEYCKMAEKRIEPYLIQQTIF
jgi:DNA modification methylase